MGLPRLGSATWAPCATRMSHETIDMAFAECAARKADGLSKVGDEAEEADVRVEWWSEAMVALSSLLSLRGRQRRSLLRIRIRCTRVYV